MKTLALMAAAILALVLISKLVDFAQPLPETGDTAVAMPDAVQTRLAVMQQVPLQTPIADAARSMVANGFRCTAVKAARYLDVTEPPGGEGSRGPADVLRCDPGRNGDGTARRWQVVFEDTGGRVSHIGVGSGAGMP